MNGSRFFVLVLFLGLLFAGGANISRDLESAFESLRISILDSISVKKLYFELLERINLEKRVEYHVIFVGDVMLSRGVGYQIKKNNNPQFPFLKIVDFLNSGDLVFGNLEGPISTRGEDVGSIYSFRADPSVTEGLKFVGFDVLSLANNHIFDWGETALIDTIDILEKNGIQVVGAGKNYELANKPKILRVGDSKVAFLAYTDLYPESLAASNNSAGISLLNFKEIKQRIAEVRDEVDLIVVSFHWGEEYESAANENQKRIARDLIDSGADLIVGHHPHVVQEVENYSPGLPTSGQGWIIYSLGNFTFDQSFSEETMKGIAVVARVRGGEIVGLDKINININENFQPYISVADGD